MQNYCDSEMSFITKIVKMGNLDENRLRTAVMTHINYRFFMQMNANMLLIQIEDFSFHDDVSFSHFSKFFCPLAKL